MDDLKNESEEARAIRIEAVKRFEAGLKKQITPLCIYSGGETIQTKQEIEG